MRLLTLRSPPDTGASIHWTHCSIAQVDWLMGGVWRVTPSLSRSKSSMLLEYWGVTLKFHFRPFTRTHLSSFEFGEFAKSTWHLSHNFIIRLAAREPQLSPGGIYRHGTALARDFAPGPGSQCSCLRAIFENLITTPGLCMSLSGHVPRARADHWCGGWWDSQQTERATDRHEEWGLIISVIEQFLWRWG